MPRLPRIGLPGYPQHLVQRGHSRQPCFADERDYRTYQNYLGEAARRYGCEVHAYMLMTNHVYLLVTPRHKQTITRMMQLLGRRYVRHFNSKYRVTCGKGVTNRAWWIRKRICCAAVATSN